jgi:hypothetical protein
MQTQSDEGRIRCGAPDDERCVADHGLGTA